MNNTIRKIIFYALILIITILAVVQIFLYCSILFSFIAPALTVPIALLVVVTICIHNEIKQYEYKEEFNDNYKSIKIKEIYDYRKIYIDTIKSKFEKDFNINLNVPMSEIIEMDNDFPKAYRKTLNEIIDIVLYDKITSEPTLLIRIDNNKKENSKLTTLCKIAEIKIIKFKSNINNSDEFIINKVKNALRDSK